MGDFTTAAENVSLYRDFYKDGGDYHRWGGADRAFVRELFQKLSLQDDRPKILELGTGTGYFLSLIDGMFDYDLYGTDISEEGVQTARERYNLENVCVMDTYDLTFGDDFFDVVLAIGHSPFNTFCESDFSGLLSRVERVIKPGGYCVYVWSTNFTQRTSRGHIWDHFCNPSSQFVNGAFAKADSFDEINRYAFVRPLASLFGRQLLTEWNRRLTEGIVRIVPFWLNGRLTVIGRKK